MLSGTLATGDRARAAMAHHAYAVSTGAPLLHYIWLPGIRIDANAMQGTWQMIKQGDAITVDGFALLVPPPGDLHSHLRLR